MQILHCRTSIDAKGVSFFQKFNEFIIFLEIQDLNKIKQYYSKICYKILTRALIAGSTTGAGCVQLTESVEGVDVEEDVGVALSDKLKSKI